MTTRIVVRNLQPHTLYSYRVRGINGPIKSEWSPLGVFTTITDEVLPDTPTGFTWVPVGNSFHAEWNAVTENLDGEEILVVRYELELVANDVTKIVSVTPTTGDKVTYDLTFEGNIALWGAAFPIITARVRTVDNRDLKSEWSALVTATNAAPDAPQFVVATAGLDNIAINWTASDSIDVVSYSVHVSTNAGFTPTDGNRIFLGNALSTTYQTTTYLPHYFKVAAVDEFRQKSTYTASNAATPTAPATVDNIAPGVPTGLAAAITPNSNGTGATAAVTWNAVADGDLAGYVLRYRKNGSSSAWTEVSLSEDTTVTVVQLNEIWANYDFQVRAVDYYANFSAWSGVYTASGGSNTAPSVPTGFTSVATRDAITYSWTPVADTDLKNYEVTFSSSSTFAGGPPTTITYLTGTSSTFTVSGLTPGTTYYARVRAVDTGGLQSAFTATDTKATLAYGTNSSDGVAPASSPAATVTSGLGNLFVSWPAVSNNDPVTYEVHISTTTGFTPSAATKVVETSATAASLENTATGTALTYGTPYFVRVIAKDRDGAAAAGTQGSGSLSKVTSTDSSLTAADVSAPTITQYNTLNSLVATKARVWVQGTVPTSTAIGDVWINTSDNNKTYTASVVGASAIVTTGNGWYLRQDGTKTTTFAQATIPTSAAIGDLWTDTSTSPYKIYRAYAVGATTIAAGQWQLIQDISNLATTTYVDTQISSSASGKNKITHSTSAASGTYTGIQTGDTWFQVDDFTNNRVIGQWRWNGTGWISETLRNEVIANLDASKLTANSVITNALGVKNTLTLGDAGTAGIIQTYNYSAGTAGFKLGSNGLEINQGIIRAPALFVTVGGGNLLSNTSGNSDLNGWGQTYSTNQTSATTVVDSSSPTGYAFNFVNPGSNTWAIFWYNNYPAGKIQAGRTYTFSYWLKNMTAGTKPLNVNWLTGSSEGEIGAFSSLNVPTTWTRYVKTFVATGNSIANSGPHFSFGDPGNAGTIRITGVQLELGDVASSYSPKADEILPGTISGEMLKANTALITNLNIGSGGAITSSNYVINTKGWRLSESGLEINEGSVKSGALSIGAMSSSLIQNGNFQDGSNGAQVSTGNVPGWIWGGQGTGQAYLEDNAVFPGSRAMVMYAGPEAGNNSSIFSNVISVSGGDTLSVTATVAKVGNVHVNFIMRFEFYDKDMVNLAAPNNYVDAVWDDVYAYHTDPVANWERKKGTVTVPEAAKFARLRFYNYMPAAATYICLSDVIVQKPVVGVQIANGAIQGQHLEANTALIKTLYIGSGGAIQSSNWNGTNAGFQLDVGGLTVYNGTIKADTIIGGTWGSQTGRITIAAGSSLMVSGGAGGGSIYSSTYNGSTAPGYYYADVNATSGFYLGDDGLVIAQGKVKANALYGGTFNAGIIKIDSAGAIQSVNYSPGSAGWYIGNGAFEVNDGSIKAPALNIGVGGGNLLRNSSFESGISNVFEFSPGWTLYNNSAATEPSTMSSVAGRTGGVAVRHSWTGTNTATKGIYPGGAANQNITKPNTTYIVSFYARSSTPVTFGMYFNTYPASFGWLANPTTSSTVWQRYIYKMTMGATTESNPFFVSILNGVSATGWVEFDDIQLEEGDVATSYAASSTYIDGSQVATGAIRSTATAQVWDSTTNTLVDDPLGRPAWYIDVAGNARLGRTDITGNVTVGSSTDAANALANIQSSNFVSGFGGSGWQIRGDGVAEFRQMKAESINGNAIITDTLDVKTLKNGDLNAAVNVKGSIIVQNPTTGAQVGMSGEKGFFVYGPSPGGGVQGPTYISFPVDGAPNIISGTLKATTLEVIGDPQTGNAASFSRNSTIQPNAKFTLLDTATTTQPPVVSTSYPMTGIVDPSLGTMVGGLNYSTDDGNYYGVYYTGGSLSTALASPNPWWVRAFNSAGANIWNLQITGVANYNGSANVNPPMRLYGVVRRSNELWIVGFATTGTTVSRRIWHTNLSGQGIIGNIDGGGNMFGSLGSATSLATVDSAYVAVFPVYGGVAPYGANAVLGIGTPSSFSGTKYCAITVGTLDATLFNAAIPESDFRDPSETGTWAAVSGGWIGQGPFSGGRILIANKNNITNDIKSYQTTVKDSGNLYNVPVVDEQFPIGSTALSNITYNGSNLMGTSAGSLAAVGGYRALVKYSNITWTTGTTGRWGVATTRYDTTNGYQSTASPVSYFNMIKRASLSVTADSGTASGSRVYVGRKSTDTLNPSTEMYYQAPTAGPGTVVLTYDNVSFSGTNAPVSNSFPASGANGGQIVSFATDSLVSGSLENSTVIRADGYVRMKSPVAYQITLRNTTAAAASSALETALRVGNPTGNHLRFGPTGVFGMQGDSTQGAFQTNNPFSTMQLTYAQSYPTGWSASVYNAGQTKGNIAQDGSGFHTIGVAGYYLVIGWLKLNIGTFQGERQLLKLEKFTTEGIAGGYSIAQSEGAAYSNQGSASGPFTHNASGIVYCNVGDRIRMIFYCNLPGFSITRQGYVDNASYSQQLQVMMIA